MYSNRNSFPHYAHVSPNKAPLRQPSVYQAGVIESAEAAAASDLTTSRITKLKRELIPRVAVQSCSRV